MWAEELQEESMEMAFLSALLVIVAKITYGSAATRRGLWAGLGLRDTGGGGEQTCDSGYEKGAFVALGFCWPLPLIQGLGV